MKNKIKVIAAALVIVGAMGSGCMSSTESSTKSEKKVSETDMKASDEKKEFEKDVEVFRKTAENKIAANEKQMELYSKQAALKRGKAKTDFEKTIEELKDENADMKKRIGDFKSDTKQGWEVFKKEFNHDMSKLKKSFEDFANKIA